MTVAACLIVDKWTVHSSDSLLTRRLPDGRLDELEWEEPKIVPVQAFRGALAYYGFAGLDPARSTLEWLRTEARQAHRHASAQAFAAHLATSAEQRLRALGLHRTPSGGLGIHLSAYEWCDGSWVPELFHIRNWRDETYSEVSAAGVWWSRDTYSVLSGSAVEATGALPGSRSAVRDFLRGGGFFRFNNGDPHLFNPLASAIHDAGYDLLKRVPGGAAAADAEKWRALARRPVELIADLELDFLGPGARTVGGRTHDLVITPGGQFDSRSGIAG